MDPVCRYIPEFAQHGKEGVTLLHVLAHQSGFPRAPSSVDRDLVFDFDGMVQMLCSMKPAHRPGHDMAYHAITGGYILGEVVRRVTGKSVSEYLQDTLRGPMGWRYFTYGADDAVVPEIAVNENTGYPLVFPFTTLTERALGCAWSDVLRFTRDPRFYRVAIPAANLVATADEMSEFFQLLLDGGTLRNTRVFQPETVRRATLEAGKMRMDGSMVLLPMRYSAGMMLGADPIGLYGPRSGHAFGHWGFINSFSWADPSRAIAVSILNSGKPFLGPHVLRHFALFGLIDRHCPQDAVS
jgi:CubicO group peptidase (beta-lactamase class C family)